MMSVEEHGLYDQIQSVVMPEGITKKLRLQVAECNSSNPKVVVRLTDDANPSILYVLQVTEMDFCSIKAQQGLLVDFKNFPIHLVKLFEQCLNGVKGFILILEENGLELYLKVVQPIDLKNLCYIALRVAKGCDSEIMKHMQNQIVHLKESLNSKECECNNLHGQVSALQQDLHSRERKMQEHQQYCEEEHRKLQTRAAREMDQLREQLHQEKKRDLDSAYHQQEGLNTRIEELNKDLAKYKTKHRHMCDKYDQAQETLREQERKLSMSEERQAALNRELAEMRRHNADLESECRSKAQESEQNYSRAEALDKELTRLRNRLSRQEGLLRESDSEQMRLKSVISRLQDTSDARNDLVLQLNGDLTKANLIIKERQKDVEKLQTEIKRVVSITKEQERKLTNMELEMKLLRANADRDTSRIKALEISEKELQSELAEAKAAISSKEEEHKKCGDVISYLHRSLNRLQLDQTANETHHPQTILHSSAPSAPILHTLGSSMLRTGIGLHLSAPPVGGHLPTGPLISGRPFSSTPLVQSAASGGTGTSTRRSYPGALNQDKPSSKVPAQTPARPQVDRLVISHAKPKTKSQKKAVENGSKRQVDIEEKDPSAAVSAPVSKSKTTEKSAKNKTSDKENKDWAAFKPSAYFQPNKIITEF